MGPARLQRPLMPQYEHVHDKALPGREKHAFVTAPNNNKRGSPIVVEQYAGRAC